MVALSDAPLDVWNAIDPSSAVADRREAAGEMCCRRR